MLAFLNTIKNFVRRADVNAIKLALVSTATNRCAFVDWGSERLAAWVCLSLSVQYRRSSPLSGNLTHVWVTLDGTGTGTVTEIDFHFP